MKSPVNYQARRELVERLAPEYRAASRSQKMLLLAERGTSFMDAPELEKRCRPHLKAANDSWRMDEIYIKIKGTWTYLYRAVDSDGNSLEFLLSPTRDAEAAKRFFLKALHSSADSAPQAHLVEEQVAEPTAAANSVTPGQVQGVGKGDIKDQVTFIARNGPRPLTPPSRGWGKSLAERPVAA